MLEIISGKKNRGVFQTDGSQSLIAYVGLKIYDTCVKSK